MKLNLKKPSGSVFLKLFLVMIATGGFLAAIFFYAMFFAMRPQFEPTFHQNAERYARYLVADLGQAPHFEKGSELCKQLGIAVRIDGNGWTWSSSSELAKLDHIPPAMPPHPGRGGSPPPFPHFGGPKPGFGPSVTIDYEFKSGPAKVFITSGSRFVLQPNYLVIFVSIALFGMVLMVGYLTIRWILSPIHLLVKGVDELSSGNLNYQIPKTSSDELGRLSMAFNEMVVRVRQMVSSKQQLLVDVSHELRSPLTRAKVSLELMDESENVTRVTEDLNEIDDMIEELLESARMESGSQNLSLEKLDGVALAREVTNQYAALGKEVRLVTVVPECQASLDMLRFKSVLRNLIENAIKYSPADKPVTVTVSRQDKFLSIDVKDEGMGIPASEATKVFESFYRVDKSRNRRTGGFGLGLSLCKKIVEAHGGSIRVVPETAVGTRIQALFPLA